VDIKRLGRAMSRPEIDDDGLPPPSRRVVRDSDGRLPGKPPGAIRDAILRALGVRGITRYQLWKMARGYCATLPESAVYEFLRGQRAISVTYCESLLAALNLAVMPLRKSA